MNVDMGGALSDLAVRRPVFHSERDFQHALAWQIQLNYPQAEIRLETRPRTRDQAHGQSLAAPAIVSRTWSIRSWVFTSSAP